MSNGTHAGERLAVRLTKGALVAVLVGGMTAVAASAHEGTGVVLADGSGAQHAATATGSAGGAGATPALEVAEARSAVVDVAADALAVAEAAHKAGEDTDVDSKKLTALEKATDKLAKLVEKARTTPVDADASDTSAAATDRSTPTPASRSTARADAATTSDDATTSDSASNAAEDAPASGTAADASSSDTSDTSSSDTSPSDTSSASADATGSPDAAATADASPQVDTAPSAPAVEGPLTSAGETPDVLAPLVAAAEAEQAPHTVDELVVPEVTGPEDRTTAELRAALDTIVELAGSVEDTAQARQDAADAAAAKRAAWEKSLQGYANGRIPASALCSPPFDSDALLRCDAADALEQLDKAYKAEFGTHIKLTDSYRSYAGQVSCRARKGSLCAVPGTSNHGTGVAVDFAGGIQTFGSRQHKWMVAHAAEFGWHHPAWAHAGGSKPEAWHWEYAA